MRILTHLPFIAFSACALAAVSSAHAKLSVLTSTTDLAAVTREVGGGEVSVESIAKGTQDPHFIEAKPSFMVKASRADLVISNGLELEIGWLPSILRGARNPKVMPGSAGDFEVGLFIPVLEKATGQVTRAEGDVHPEGNPHFMLDPIRAGTVARKIADKLGSLDAAHAKDFTQRAQVLAERLAAKTEAWKKRLAASGVKSVVTEHKTLTYFFDRFGIDNTGLLEPKPGIPPTATHIVELTNLIKAKKVPVILVENFFDTKAAERIAKDVPGLRVRSVAVAVEGDDKTKSLDDLYENLVSAIEGK